jgi:hypothetical protein
MSKNQKLDGALLPITGNLARVYVLSLIVVAVTAVTSVIGLLYQTTIYPTEELRQTYVINDALNLIIGLPILLGSMWLAWRRRMVGILLWPGGLLYGLYNYTACIFGMPLSLNTVTYLIIVFLSAYAIIELIKNMDKQAIQAQIADAVPIKTTGWLLVVFGILFIARAVATMVGAGINQTTIPAAEFGTLIADILLSLFWIAGGVLLLRRMSLGYVSGLGLLFAICMLFVGLVLLLLFQPAITDVPFVLMDVIVVAVLGLIFFIPFGLFVRGVVRKGESNVS